jgi:hypothetical protein
VADLKTYLAYGAHLMRLLPSVLAVVEALEQHGVPRDEIDDVITAGLEMGLQGVVASLAAQQAAGPVPPPVA